MPKELARVMADYNTLQNRVGPLLTNLSTRLNDYIVLRDAFIACLDELSKDLKRLGVKSPADPKAQRDNGVDYALKNVDKYGSLMEARRGEWDQAALKVEDVRQDVLTLQRDVVAVARSKSGFFSTSKSLPQLKALSTTLTAFAGDLQKATTLGN